MPWVLPPLLETTQHVVVADNQSCDGTAEMARRAAAGADATDRLTVVEYPFPVSRCGPEHLATPERSRSSLAYFYNWSFAHVRTTYSLKWDGDMVLTKEGAATFADLAWQLGSTKTVVTMPRHPLFVESDRVAHLDLGLRNIEPWVYPMGAEYTFVGVRVGAATVPGQRAADRAARRSVRRAEVSRLGRVRALDGSGLIRDQRPYLTQASGVAGVPRAVAGRKRDRRGGADRSPRRERM